MSFTNTGFNVGKRLLVVGSIRGYRAWVLGNDPMWSPRLGLRLGYCLNPTGIGAQLPDSGWKPGENVSRCARWNSYWGIHEFDFRCTCGFYAMHHMNDFRDRFLCSLTSWSTSPAFIYGAIEGSGSVLVGTKGFRAEKARILGLVIGNSSIAKHLGARYKVPVFRSRRKMLREFPPIDTSPLKESDDVDD